MCLTFPVGAATVPDFQAIMDGLQEKLDAATDGMWTEHLWSEVAPNPPGTAAWKQKGPGFSGADHTGNGINDDDHLALLQLVLEGAAPVRAVMGTSVVEQVKTSFEQNRAAVVDREAWYEIAILDSSRTDVRRFGVSLNGRPMSLERTRLSTGAEQALSICVDLGVFTICNDEIADLPGIWTADGLLSEHAPGLADDLAVLMAAYLSMGSQDKVDYLQALLYQVVARGILPRSSSPLFEAVKHDSVSPALEYRKSASHRGKAYVAPLFPDTITDTVYEPPLRNCLNSACTDYADIVRIVLQLFGDSVQQGVGRDWLEGYQLGANGFDAGYVRLLAASGDIDGDGVENGEAYAAASDDRGRWLEALWVEPTLEGEGDVEGEDGEENYVEVPEVTGMTVADAAARLLNSNLEYAEQRVCDDTVPEGIVIASLPPGGTSLPSGAVVDLRVSAGSCPGHGCDAFGSFDRADLFIGVLAVLVLLLLRLFSSGDTDGASPVHHL